MAKNHNKIEGGCPLRFIFVVALALVLTMQLSVVSAKSTDQMRGDAEYQALVKESEALDEKIDKLRGVIDGYRNDYASGKTSLASTIEQSELQLFDLQQQHNTLAQQIAARVQSWELSRIGDAESSGTERPKDEIELTGDDWTLGTISSSKLFESILSLEDIERLRGMEADESRLWDLYVSSVDGYSRLVELAQRYSQTKKESEAIGYKVEFDKVAPMVDSLFEELGDEWSELYDHKVFCYAVLLESLGRNGVLESGEQILRDGVSGIVIDEQNPYHVAQLYDMQKRALLSYESSISKDLGFVMAHDSLRVAIKRVTSRGGVEPMSRVEIVERNFIDYYDVKFSTTSIYKKASQIPVAKKYPRGRVYRIQLGAFKMQQLPSIFRGAHPLSYNMTYGFWTYYAGAFATYVEAEKAQRLCKAKGFSRPEIVVWDNGARRNYTREPLPSTKGFRVIIEGVEELPDEVNVLIKTMCGGAEMSKLGAEKYIVATIALRPKAVEFAEAVKALNKEFVCEVIEIK